MESKRIKANRLSMDIDYTKDRLALKNFDLTLISITTAINIAVALLIVYIGLYQALSLSITIQLTLVGYLLLRRSFSVKALDQTDQQLEPFITGRSESFSVFFGILVALLLIVAIFVSANSLKRPLWVFFILAIVPGLILTQRFIFFNPQNTNPFLLVQVAMLACAIVMTGVTVFPFNGGDTWAHLQNAREVLEEHTVEAVPGAYHDYPLYPALLAVFSTLTGADSTDVARFMNAFVACVCLLIVHSLSRKLGLSSSHSLILVLLLLGSKWFIYWLMAVVAMTTGTVFYCLLVAIVLSHLFEKLHPRVVAILLLVSSVTPFFHPAIAIATVLLYLGFWVVESFSPGRYKSVNRHSWMNLALFTTTIALAQGIFFGDFVFERTVNAIADTFLRGGAYPVGLAESYRDPITYTLDELNFYCLLGLSGLEILRQIRFGRERLNLVAGFLGLFFVAFSYITEVINFQEALPYRWLLFGTILLVFPASTAFITLFQRGSKWRRTLAIIGLGVYFFAGLTNTEVNQDRPLYNEPITQRSDVTSSEYAGMTALQQILRRGNANIRVDFRLWDYLKLGSKDDDLGYWLQIRPEEFDGIFPIRDVYFSRSWFVGDSAVEVDRLQPHLSQFYDSGDMQLMDKVGDPRLGD
jgi:hypothetical protein